MTSRYFVLTRQSSTQLQKFQFSLTYFTEVQAISCLFTTLTAEQASMIKHIAETVLANITTGRNGFHWPKKCISISEIYQRDVL